MITFYKRNQNWRTFDYFQKEIVCESQWLLYKKNQNWRTFDYFQKVIVCEPLGLLFIKEIQIGAPPITFKNISLLVITNVTQYKEYL